MSLSPQLRSELLELLAEMCEGAASDATCERIHELTANSQEARQFYIRHMHLAASLRWSFDDFGRRDTAADDSAAGPSADVPLRDSLLKANPAVIPAKPPALARASLSPHTVSRIVGVVAVMIVIGYFAALAAMLGWDHYTRSGLQNRNAVAEAPREIATLGESQNCEWENQADAPRTGSSIGSDPLRLLSGVAEIRFASGATVFIEGPTEFQVQSVDRGFLAHGKLLARVSKSAIGFTIGTNTAEIVDLGTEFGVEVDRLQRTELHVVEGKVRLLAHGPQRDESREEIVVAGEARRVVGIDSGKIGVTATEGWRFDGGRFALAANGSARRRAEKSKPAARSAKLLLHYDVNDPASWSGERLRDLTFFGDALTPGSGSPRKVSVVSGDEIGPGDFASPVYTKNGARTLIEPPQGFQARDRAYLDFKKLGVLVGSTANRDQTRFNSDEPGNANVSGYTLEGYFLIRTGYLAAENSGIGFSQSTAGENQLIRIPRGTNSVLRSNSTLDNLVGDPQSTEQIDADINSIIPRDAWFHFVKVHDPVADQIRFYINGVLQSGFTQSLDPDSSALEYHSVGINYGNVGMSGRELRDIGYSMTRFYRGALSDAEILANFQEVAFEPIPAKSTDKKE